MGTAHSTFASSSIVGFFLYLPEAIGFGWVLASMINAVIGREERQQLDRVVGMRSMNLFEGDEL